MATISLELYRSKKLTDGRHPIMIRVTKDGERARLAVGSATLDEWDESKKQIRGRGRKTASADNVHIDNEFLKYKQRFNELRQQRRWKPSDVFADSDNDNYKTFQEHAIDYIESLSNNSLLYIESVHRRLAKIYRFKPKPFGVEEIDDKWLNGFIKHCQNKESGREKDKGNSKNTINHSIKLIGTIINFSGVPNTAVSRYKVTFDKNIRAKLSESELKRFIEVELIDSTLDNSRNIFLLQYYARGMRIGDALRLKQSDYKDGYLSYVSRKTGQRHTIKVVKQLDVIIKKYLADREFLFPFVKGTNLSEKDLNIQVKYRTKVVNKALKEISAILKIDKPISSHIARHTFASIADKKLGGDLKDLQGMLGHSSRAMTEVYIRDLRKYDEMDEIADKLFD